MQKAIKKNNTNKLTYSLGVIVTLMIALFAKILADLPYMAILGQLVLAILIGMAWRSIAGLPEDAAAGASFSSKKLLRAGIILLGMRLNLNDIWHAGPKIFVLATINIAAAMLAVYTLARLLKVNKKLAILTACGTAICGAAAVVAISAQIRANDDETAIGAATVAILGTLFTLLYTMIYPILGFTSAGYGIFSGATLHEIAHVLAAAAPAGKDAVNLAIVVKLTRVAMLIPVALLIGVCMNRSSYKADQNERRRALPIPWFILGFLAVSALNTLGVVPESIVTSLVSAAYLLIAMAMAGLGLNVDFLKMKQHGGKTFSAGLFGSILLSILGYWLVHVLHLA